ncbi:MAG: peptide ABC transporter substrate-binding protein [Chloroflexi bacterium]|nr:peptide ABC transporter substrate-binding protein [Chloroflexota bacterium]
MKHIRGQAIVALTGIALLSAILIFLALSANTVERPNYGGTHIEGVAGRPSALNPIFSQYNEVDRDIAALIFTGLTRADENGIIQPDLATRWVVSPDGLVYTFTLRADVRWHNGARFDAQDVLYTIQAIQSPEYKGPPDLAIFWRTVAISPVDSSTVRFQLTQAYAPFLEYTTIGMLPASLLSDVSPTELAGHPFNKRPVGTGPFRYVEATADSLTLEANPHYYGTRALLARVQFRFYPDYETIFAAFNRGEVEGISRILPNYLPKARAVTNLKLYHARLSGYSLIFLNLSKPAFQDKAVRQALLYATDRDKLVSDVLQGQAMVAPSPIEPGAWANDATLKPYPYDVAKANALLDAAGWRERTPDGTRQKNQQAFAFTLVTSDDPTRSALANEIAKAWQAIGVKAVVQSVPPTQLLQNFLRLRQFDAVLYEWRTSSSDPDQYENWHQTQIPAASNMGQNYSGLNDRDFSEVLEAARKTSDQAKRVELYQKFQQLFADRVPALLLYYPIYTYGVDARIRGVQLAPLQTASDRFRNLAQWYVKTKRVAAPAEGK